MTTAGRKLARSWRATPSRLSTMRVFVTTWPSASITRLSCWRSWPSQCQRRSSNEDHRTSLLVRDRDGGTQQHANGSGLIGTPSHQPSRLPRNRSRARSLVGIGAQQWRSADPPAARPLPRTRDRYEAISNGQFCRQGGRLPSCYAVGRQRNHSLSLTPDDDQARRATGISPRLHARARPASLATTAVRRLRRVRRGYRDGDSRPGPRRVCAARRTGRPSAAARRA
jgi:hypothetical protein